MARGDKKNTNATQQLSLNKNKSAATQRLDTTTTKLEDLPVVPAAPAIVQPVAPASAPTVVSSIAPVHPEHSHVNGRGGVHDSEIDLGFQLRAANATSWGRDKTVLANSKQLSTSATTHGAGKGGVSGSSASGNSGPNYGAASNSGDNSAMHSSGTSSTTGVATDTGDGTRRSGAASTESNSANANKQ